MKKAKTGKLGQTALKSGAAPGVEPQAKPSPKKALASGKPKFTPGPWLVESVSGSVRVSVELTRHSGNGFLKVILARCSPPQLPEEEAHANAYLIAAAPEMYADLEVLTDKLEQVTRTTGHNFAELIAIARLHMAKARGESQ